MENEGNNFQHWTAANIEFYSITVLLLIVTVEAMGSKERLSLK